MKKLIFTLLFLHFIINISTAQWVLQNTGSTTDFHSVKFINKNTGWICGTGVIAKTTNAGVNWVHQSHPATNKRLDCLSVVDSNTVYCVGMFKTILKTTNGGTNWIAIQNGPYGTGESYNASSFINNNTGWITGTGGKIWKTTNGGDSLFKLNEVWGSLDIYFIDSLTGLMCGDMGYLKRTTDGGITWYTPNIELHFIGYTFHKIAVFSNQYCWIVGRFSTPVYRSTDFGINWDSIGRVPGIFDIYSVRFSNSNTGWCGGGGTPGVRMFKTTNGGYNWVRMDNDNNPGYVDDIYFYNDSIGWATGSNGMVLYTTNGGLTFVNQISNNTPKSFELHQNYPNPFNPVTKINYALPNQRFVTLKIYDITSREIQTLVNEVKQAGYYTVDFNGSHLSSGVYFYKIKSSYFVSVKRMVLIK